DGASWSTPTIIGGITEDNTLGTPPFSVDTLATVHGVANVPVTTAGGRSSAPIPMVGPNGEIYVVWEERGPDGRARIMFDASYDGGQNWGGGQDKLSHDAFVNFGTGFSAVLPTGSDPGISAADLQKLNDLATLLQGDASLRLTISGYT